MDSTHRVTVGGAALRDIESGICRLGVKGCGAEDAGARSAYPPILSVNADIPARQPSANSRLTHCSKQVHKLDALFDHLIGAKHEPGFMVAKGRYNIGGHCRCGPQSLMDQASLGDW
jgi:hypothetical protein